MQFILGMMTKTRGTAVVEYAVLLLVLMSLAGIGFKRLGGRAHFGASGTTTTIEDGLRRQHADAEEKSEARHHEGENRSRRH